MNKFLETPFGFINAELPGGTLGTLRTLLKSHVTNCGDFDFLTSGKLAQEILPTQRLVVGKSFKAFLIANYNDGLGRRTAMVRSIIRYIKGEISARSLSSQLRMEEVQLSTLLMHRDDVPVTPKNRSALNDLDRQALDEMKEDGFYVLLAGIGSQLTSRLLLTFMGESAYD